MNTQATAEDVLRLFKAPVNRTGVRVLRSFVSNRGSATAETSSTGVDAELCLGPRVGGGDGSLVFGPRV